MSFLALLFNKSHIARAVCHNIIYSGQKYFQLKYCIYILYNLLPAFWRAVLIANIKYEDNKHLNYSLPHHCTLQWEEISFNYCFNRISLFQINSAPHRWHQCSCLSTFTIYFCILNNGKCHLKSLESQFRFVCLHFGSINSNCVLCYL